MGMIEDRAESARWESEKRWERYARIERAAIGYNIYTGERPSGGGLAVVRIMPFWRFTLWGASRKAKREVARRAATRRVAGGFTSLDMDLESEPSRPGPR
jgi:hypothetical protein